MDEWLRVLSATLAVFGVVGLGGLLRRVNWLTEEADTSLLKVVVRVLVPCLIVRSVVGNAALDQANNIWLPPVVGYLVTAAAIGVSAAFAWWLGPRIGLRSAAARRTFALGVGLHNYSYLPIPLAESLYPAVDGAAGAMSGVSGVSGASEVSGVLGVLFVTNVGVDLCMWTMGVAVVSGTLGWSGLRRMVNGPSVAVVVALTLHFAGARSWFPEATAFVWKGVNMLGACAVPVALLLIGATMMDALAGLKRSREPQPIDNAGDKAGGYTGGRSGGGSGGGGWWMMGGACGLRLGLLPVLFLGLAYVLPGVVPGGASVELQRVLLLHGAMPAAVFPIILARHYGGDASTATLVALSTSAVSLLTMPMWLALGARWLGV